MPAEPVPPVQRSRWRLTRWGAAVPAVFALAGLVATTSAQTARGTDLRSVGRTDTADLIREQQHRADVQEAQVRRMRADVRALTDAASPTGSRLDDLEKAAGTLAGPAGATPVQGAGVSVRLDDAPRDGPLARDFTPDELVVHQQDLQAVVNALWASGADAMMLMDQRVISTSGVRCAGNVLILQGRVYSPPYTVRAIGDPARLLRTLEESPALQDYRSYVEAAGLGYEVRTERLLRMPGYDGPVTLRHARVPDGEDRP